LAHVAESLAALVRDLRGWTRLGQVNFAKAAGVAKNTVSRLEAGVARTAEPATLRLIAEAAIREGAGDEARSADLDEVYARLMRAAGHLPSAVTETATAARRVEDLTDEEIEAALRRRMADPEAAVALASIARDWQDLDEGDHAVIQLAIDTARKRAQRIRQQQRAGS
jgi:transcriptional regulator with XRE-family HTH domain